jgi:hypothetical protein
VTSQLTAKLPDLTHTCSPNNVYHLAGFHTRGVPWDIPFQPPKFEVHNTSIVLLLRASGYFTTTSLAGNLATMLNPKHKMSRGNIY